MRNWLIGNGLNLTNYEKNYFLAINSIYNRFINNLINYWELINKLFYQDKMDLEELVEKLDSSNKKGIEDIAGIVFQYVYEQIELKRKFNKNDSYRLVEILGEISIKSIFFKDNSFNIPKISDDYINKILNDYNKIFTLNYIEDWDKNSKVKYLHGNVKKYINSYCDICSSVLSYNKEYCNLRRGNYVKVDFKDIVFMPTNNIVDKYNYIIGGLYPSNDLFPAEDLFPYGGRDIYKDLDSIDNIEIFGMSPYGDKTIIDKIKKIKNKRIFVYNSDEDEINEWKKYGINDCFIDSSRFLIE